MSAIEKPRRNAAASRARILAAATTAFAQNGYAATGIRDIASAAQASLPLLSRYFGSKAGLFEAALRDALAAKPYLDFPRAEFGLSLVTLISQAPRSDLPMAISILAAGDPEARVIATRVVRELVVQPLAQWLGPPDADRRAVAITMLGAGLVTHLRLLPLLDETAIAAPDDPLVRWYAAAIQSLVDVGAQWP